MDEKRTNSFLIRLFVFCFLIVLVNAYIDTARRNAEATAEKEQKEQAAAIQAAADEVRRAASSDQDLAYGESDATQLIEGPSGFTYRVPATWEVNDVLSDDTLTQLKIDGYDGLFRAFVERDLCLSCTSADDVLEVVWQSFADTEPFKGAPPEACQEGAIGDAIWQRYPLATLSDGQSYELSESHRASYGYLEIVMTGRDTFVFVSLCAKEDYTREVQQEMFRILNSIDGVSDGPLFAEGEEAEAIQRAREKPDQDEWETVYDVFESYGIFRAHTVLGTGDDVIALPIGVLDTAMAYPCLLEVSYEGAGDLTLKLQSDAAGEQYPLLEHSGPYHGVTTNLRSNLWETGLSKELDVAADGDWSITFKPFTSMEYAIEDRAYEGDGLVYLDEESIETVHFVHEGEGAFTALAVGLEGSERLVDVTGPYDESVDWIDPHIFFVVESEGAWSMSWE